MARTSTSANVTLKATNPPSLLVFFGSVFFLVAVFLSPIESFFGETLAIGSVERFGIAAFGALMIFLGALLNHGWNNR